MKVLMNMQAMKPSAYIYNITSPRHMVIFYRDKKKARKIEFQFILNGLLKQQHCIYLTHGNTKNIENDMEKFGINVYRFLEKNLLHIYKIRDPFKDPKGVMHGYRSVIKQILADSKPPYRIAGRLIEDLSTKEAVKAELQMEHSFHNNFENFDGHVLCSYPYDDIEPTQRSKWVSSIITEHNAAVFLPQHLEGISFNLP